MILINYDLIKYVKIKNLYSIKSAKYDGIKCLHYLEKDRSIFKEKNVQMLDLLSCTSVIFYDEFLIGLLNK